MKKIIAITATYSILALMLLWQYQEARAVRLIHIENLILKSTIPRMALYNALTNRNLQGILSQYGMRLSKLEQSDNKREVVSVFRKPMEENATSGTTNTGTPPLRKK